MKISQLTRRDIVDFFTAHNVCWHGRLGEIEFLARLFDLKKLSSLDSRFKDAEGDIWQHRINNNDWDDDWIFHDTRFNLLAGPDETFLRFLTETLHPVVRPDSQQVRDLAETLNQSLQNDGFRLVERTRLSGKPVYAGKFVGVHPAPGLSVAKDTLLGIDPSYIAEQIARIETAVMNDPSLAIGTSKELVETCCKTILLDRAVVFSKTADVPELVKLTVKELELTPHDIPDKAKAADTIKRLLSNLASITQGVAELRNHYGTGHGKAAGAKGLHSRHAKLAAGAASTLAVFLAETHSERRSRTSVKP